MNKNSLVQLKQGTIICVDKTCKKNFSPNVNISKNDIKKCFLFAVSMATKQKHNPDSFASRNKNFERDLDEVFRDAFQGKVSEMAFYNYYKNEFSIPEPDFSEWERGIWEDTDFQVIDNKKNINYSISIKSTKDFGNFLLLEKNRYNEEGYYVEGLNNNTVLHDLIFLVRIKGINSLNPQNYIKSDFNDIKAEIAGYITHNIFLKAIKEEQYFKAGYYINTCEALKVDNYYFCVSSLTRPKIIK